MVGVAAQPKRGGLGRGAGDRTVTMLDDYCRERRGGGRKPVHQNLDRLVGEVRHEIGPHCRIAARGTRRVEQRLEL